MTILFILQQNFFNEGGYNHFIETLTRMKMNMHFIRVKPIDI